MLLKKQRPNHRLILPRSLTGRTLVLPDEEDFLRFRLRNFDGVDTLVFCRYLILAQNITISFSILVVFKNGGKGGTLST